MTQAPIVDALRAAFPEPQGRIKAYLDAYAAYASAPKAERSAAMLANRTAWRALTEGERLEIDEALKAVTMRVV